MVKETSGILDEMENKLVEMKMIAEYAAGNEMSSAELDSSTVQMNNLNQEYQKLAESYQIGPN